MEETSGRATEAGSLSQDRHAIDVAFIVQNNKITVYKWH